MQLIAWIQIIAKIGDVAPIKISYNLYFIPSMFNLCIKFVYMDICLDTCVKLFKINYDFGYFNTLIKLIPYFKALHFII